MLLARGVHVHNAWSDTATLLSFHRAEFDPALCRTRKMVKLTLPYPALYRYCTAVLFMLLLSSVQLAFTVLKAARPAPRWRCLSA